MSTASFTAQDVALFLKDNPQFFHEHADVFADLRVPHPHETRAISLGERQIMTLRAKAKDLEWKLSGLVNNASGNEKISRTLTAWCARMLAEPDAGRLPNHIVQSLSDLFELPAVALRLWNLTAMDGTEYANGVTEGVRQYAAHLKAPYCGPNQHEELVSWLPGPPPRSVAVIALKPKDREEPFGLLVLGSDDVSRFTPDMGTAFLEIINELASAGLSRLDTAAGTRPPMGA